MSEKDIVEEARDLVIRLGQDRKSAFCKAVTHKAIEAEAQNLINRLADEVERLRSVMEQTEGLQATALQWARESIDLRSEITRLSTSTSDVDPAEAKQ